MTAVCLLPAFGQSKPRARDLGVPLEGTPGPLNAIVDVAGIEVGHRTIISGDNVRTGVTAVWPRGKQSSDPVFGGFFSQNGNGDMTGTHWLEESGFLDGPVFITNTHSVGVVRDAFLGWMVQNHRHPGTNTFNGGFYTYPIVAETYDGFLNDINGFHVKPEDVAAAIEAASAGPVPEGNVGGGTGMICYGFKGGIGTSSRKVQVAQATYTVGALVQCNCGSRRQLRIGGLPVGQELAQKVAMAAPPYREDTGSIIIVVATDAPLLPHQTKRLARRATLGLGRTGSVSGNGSGDIFIAFSTGNAQAASTAQANVTMLGNQVLDPIFEGAVQATEEAIVNAIVGAETMTGVNGHRVEALPHDMLRETLRKYNRLAEK